MRTPNVTQRGSSFQLAAWIAAATLALPAAAYESYHDPNLNDQGYCATCHPGFSGGTSDTLHAMHTGGTDPMTGNCNLCHTGSSRDNPLIMWSVGDGLGCMGCHGQDYGETIQANYRTFATAGKHKQSGYGLRRHHARAGITQCAGCHENDASVAPYGENVITTGLGFTTHYYTRTDVRLRGAPINPSNNEDTLNDADSKGLDNDGDGLYDAEDPDSTGAPVTVSFHLTSTNTVISWPYTFDGWHVQVSTDLSGAWTDLPDVPVEANGSWNVTLGPQQGRRFFRLNKRL